MSGVTATPADVERLLLQRLAAGPATGDALARDSGHTRAAVWKRIEALRAAGIAIEARAGQGYRLAQPLDLLDATAIVARLPAAVGAGLASCEVAWTVDSTNSELLRRATPAGGAAVLLAERQTGGRGRRGRAWASPLAANLYVSIARHYSGGLARLGGLSLVAGIAVAAALRALGATQVGLKWPNDLVAADGAGSLRKLGGLLVEGGGEHAGPVRAVLGIGINVRMPAGASGAIDQPWTDLARLCGPTMPTRNALAATVLAHVLPALQAFDAHGLAPCLPAYREFDLLAGRTVRVESGAYVEEGTAVGIAADGALQVRVGGVLHDVHAGDVSVRRQ